VPGCSASSTYFLPVGCSDSIATVDTASKPVAGSAANIPAGGHTCTAKMNCLRNEGDCCTQTGVHSSYASGLPSPCAFFQS
jgi:hypothetical protein